MGTVPISGRVAAALAWLEKHSKKSVRDGMARYAIPNDKALGVLMGDIQKLAKLLGRDHALALRRLHVPGHRHDWQQCRR